MFPAAQLRRRRGATERVVRSHPSCASATERDAAGSRTAPAVRTPRSSARATGGTARVRRMCRRLEFEAALSSAYPRTSWQDVGAAAGAGSLRQPPITASRSRKSRPTDQRSAAVARTRIVPHWRRGESRATVGCNAKLGGCWCRLKSVTTALTLPRGTTVTPAVTRCESGMFLPAPSAKTSRSYRDGAVGSPFGRRLGCLRAARPLTGDHPGAP
jgi:hypothetical protein